MHKLIRSRREALGLTRQEVANRCDATVSYIEKIENGEREPSLRFFRELVQVLQTSADKLLFGSVDPDNFALIRMAKRLGSLTEEEIATCEFFITSLRKYRGDTRDATRQTQGT